MSTKFVVAYGQDFEFYKELWDEDKLYLRLDTTHYEAGYGRVLVEIPIHIWEVIRRRGHAKFDLADKSDDDLRRMIESKVDERIRRYQDAVAKGEGGPFLAVLNFSATYGPADAPREQQIERGLEHYGERRKRQQQIRACIAELEQMQSGVALPEDERY
jgi:hypothetical protein